MRVCRVKNKFGFAREELVGGYRDLMFCVIYEGPRPVRVVMGALVGRQHRPMIEALKCGVDEKRVREGRLRHEG